MLVCIRTDAEHAIQGVGICTTADAERSCELQKAGQRLVADVE